MTTIEAVYRNGVFEPLGPVPLSEGSKVRINVDPRSAELLAWLDRARELREELFRKYGEFPDSTLSIAEDRRRGV
jgi:predicted DNA-binding antitoxin AbrB/MazE fold protein